ncbi:hypothetical protein [Xenorhabdus lircayensis]|uniref:Uncharacterized protein n=1 Tax=Xenorhabdus lircayensis TaxID=2763499 RepID=A0ABS0U342_9GAMM|nr:hypothetical protein [Xenorhabdus lircayensis]MBI6547206.1 hypothetical protein [Xenorhabdus lircayensis]
MKVILKKNTSNDKGTETVGLSSVIWIHMDMLEETNMGNGIEMFFEAAFQMDSNVLTE